jgi:tRNA A58 N-methylase Trm61
MGGDALARIRADTFDAVLLDLGLPDRVADNCGASVKPGDERSG